MNPATLPWWEDPLYLNAPDPNPIPVPVMTTEGTREPISREERKRRDEKRKQAQRMRRKQRRG